MRLLLVSDNGFILTLTNSYGSTIMVANMNKQPPLSLCEPLYSLENLTVLVAPLEYVLGMKMVRTREQDLKDIGAIVK